MFKKLTRILITLVVIGVLVWLLAPRIFDNAANSLISSSTTQAQGMAQFVPAQGISATSSQGEVQVNLTGLSPDTTYKLSLDKGQCGSSTINLGPAKTDANGNFYVELPLSSLDTNQTWYIDVLQQGQSVACGLLQTDASVSSQVINAGPNVFGPQTPSTDQTDQNSASTPGTSAPQQNTTSSSTLPNLPGTGVKPDDGQQYNNSHDPRKY